MASIKIIFQELIVKFMQQNKHVLIIPRGHLMTQVMPLASIFEFHQAKALKDSGFKVGMIGLITNKHTVINIFIVEIEKYHK